MKSIPLTNNTETLTKHKRIISSFAKIIPSYTYHPQPKPPSRRDKWRAEVKERKGK